MIYQLGLVFKHTAFKGLKRLVVLLVACYTVAAMLAPPYTRSLELFFPPIGHSKFQTA